MPDRKPRAEPAKIPETPSRDASRTSPTSIEGALISRRTELFSSSGITRKSPKPAIRSYNIGQTGVGHNKAVPPRKIKFKPELERVCYFRRDEAPQAISAQTQSATRGEGADSAIKVLHSHQPIFFSQGTDCSPPVHLQQLSLSEDGKRVHGQALVENLGYEKTVHARFSFDAWYTISETCSHWHHGSADGRFDYFEFVIDLDNCAFSPSKLPSKETREMSLCVRYVVNGQVHWDNNRSQNFRIQLDYRGESPSPPSVVQDQIAQKPPVFPRRFHDTDGGRLQVEHAEYCNTTSQAIVIHTQPSKSPTPLRMDFRHRYCLEQSLRLARHKICAPINSVTCATPTLQHQDVSTLVSLACNF